jgi:hypothetical protein
MKEKYKEEAKMEKIAKGEFHAATVRRTMSHVSRATVRRTMLRNYITN